MQQKSLEFEKAAVLRDKILAIDKINEKQKIVIGNCENEDFINVYVDEKDVCLQVFFLRDGKIVGREHFILNDAADEVGSELIEGFIKRFYGGTAFIPKTIYVPFINEGEILEQWLSLKKDSKVIIKIPQKGEKKKTLDMVENNAKITLEQFKIKDKQDKEIHKIALAGACRFIRTR